MESKCNDQAAGFFPSIAKAITEACTAPVKHIKAVKESFAGYNFTVNAWKMKEIRNEESFDNAFVFCFHISVHCYCYPFGERNSHVCVTTCFLSTLLI